jgi:hypothetical protein
MGVDNCLIEINGPEIPIMDGSSQPFIHLIEKAGVEEQEAAKHWYSIDTNISYYHEEKRVEMVAMPAMEYKITTLIDFNSPVLGTQHAGLKNIGDFKTEKAAASLEDAPGFAERKLTPRHVANSKRDRIGVEGLIRKWQRFCIGFYKIDRLVEAQFRCALPANFQHRSVDVSYGHGRVVTTSASNAKSDVSCASRNVEVTKRARLGWGDHANKDIFPNPVHAHGHCIVHDVVTGRHRPEHVVHSSLLFLQRHFGEAEVNLWLV